MKVPRVKGNIVVVRFNLKIYPEEVVRRVLEEERIKIKREEKFGRYLIIEFEGSRESGFELFTKVLGGM